MKALVIQLNEREVERFVLDRPTVFIGRSPSCDIVLRVKGVKPLHYLVEWVGEGEFDPNRGFWTLIDLTTERKDQARGEGVILSQAKNKLGKFSFGFTDDAWIEKEIQKGRLKGQMDKAVSADAVLAAGMGGYCLEVVSVRNDSERVEDVAHTDYFSPRSSRWLLRSATQVKFQWQDQTKASIEFQPSAEVWDIRNRDEFIHEGRIATAHRVDLTPRDVVVAKGHDKQYYIRLVPKIRVQAQWKRNPFDPVVLGLIAIIFLTFSASQYFANLPPEEKEEKEPPRLVKVEIPAPTPPPQPIAEPAPEPVEEPAAKVIEPPKPKKAPKPEPVVSAEPQPKKPSPAPAPAATVTQKPGLPTVKAQPNTAKKKGLPGVLGVLKKGTGGAKPLKADTLISDRRASEMDTPTGTVAVARSNPGALVGSKNTGHKDGVDLESAGTSLKGGFVTEPGQGGISGKDTGTLGSGALAGAKSAGTGKGGSGGSGFSNQTEIMGGLDREAVIRAIREYTQQIRSCYENFLTVNRPANSTGRVTLNWIIRPDGHVTNNVVASSSFNDPKLGGCIKGVVDKILFPKAPNGQPTRVNYPFVFQGKR